MIKAIRQILKKSTLIYGGIMALLIFVLKMVEYRYMIYQLDIEIYVGFIALLFTGLGIWVGVQLITRKQLASSSPIASSEEMKAKLDISEREMEILLLIAEGLSNQEIADKLFISIHTVKTHTSNLFGKLHAKRRTHAIQKAMEIGLIKK